MILAWLTGRAFGMARWAWVAVAIAVLGAAVGIYTASQRHRDATNREIGAAVESNKNLTETVKKVEKANEIRETVQPGDRRFYDECLRTARTPANCERFLPR